MLIEPIAQPGTVTGNPYLDELRPYIGTTLYGYDGVRSIMRDPGDDRIVGRHAFCGHFSWAVPTDEVLDELAKVGPLVEVGAGTGYWAWQLRQRGVDVVAYDLNPPPTTRNHWHPVRYGPWTEVLRGGTPKAADHPDRTLFLCWPPYNDLMAYRALRAYRGQRVAYIGEGPGGCTGDSRFHALLDREWHQVTRRSLLQWEGLHDCLTIWERR